MVETKLIQATGTDSYSRLFLPEDLVPLLNIHSEYFRNQFELPILMDTNNLLVFTVPNEKNKPIVVGIIRRILELITVTDQSVPVLKRQEALLTALATTASVAHGFEYNQIHAFVSDPKWAAIMKKKSGFATCRGEALYLNV